ncbi:hypothetical protein BDZ89DRAFT_116279 [Hymenopellis radicata]|nr:hypothetical protein BDZ89DRAFT_116279 [Hymenopellis radicata]
MDGHLRRKLDTYGANWTLSMDLDLFPFGLYVGFVPRYLHLLVFVTAYRSSDGSLWLTVGFVLRCLRLSCGAVWTHWSWDLVPLIPNRGILCTGFRNGVSMLVGV